MRIHLLPGDERLPLAAPHVAPPGHELLAVLEAAGTDAESIQHRRFLLPPTTSTNTDTLVCSSSSSSSARPDIVPSHCGTGTSSVPRDIAQHLLAVIGGIPGLKADVAEDDLIDVAVGARGGALRGDEGAGGSGCGHGHSGRG